MIFTGFKRKSNQIFFNKNKESLLEKSKFESVGLVKNVIIIVDDLLEVEWVKNQLISIFNIPASAIDSIVFQPKIKKEQKNELIFSPKDFGWHGDLKNDKLENILTNQYDLLINYSKVENVYVNLLLLQCKVAFRIGFGHLNKQLYDLIIKCDVAEFDIFHLELTKYLKILKKIK